MLGSFSLDISTRGTNILRPLSSSATRYLRSLSMSIRNGLALCAHRDLITNERDSPVNCPCTKGSAIASIAQAAYISCPVAKVTWCAVGSAVTG